MKPQLANDANLSTIKYPCIVQPKIDGVRALNINGTLTGRSLDPFKGFGITEYWSKPEFRYLDGEMTLGPNPASPDRLCSLTTGAMNAFKGVTEMPTLFWHVFDWLAEPNLPYRDRYGKLKAYVEKLNHPRVRLVPMYEVHGPNELNHFIDKFFTDGYEGAIIRNPDAPVKEGRPSKVKQELVRVKPWADTEMLVTGVTEGEENTNEATTNSLGRTERSSSQEGMIPNGRVGSIQGTLLADCYSSITGKLLFPKGLAVTVSKGCMTHDEARFYFENQHKIVGHLVKFSFMEHGTKDLPRFPGYISHRLKEDM